MKRKLSFWPNDVPSARDCVYLGSDRIAVAYIERNGVGERDQYDYALHRLPRIHPGDPDGLSVDVSASGDDLRLIIADRRDIADIRTAARGARIVCIADGFAAPKDGTLRVVAGPERYEAALFESGRWALSGRYGRDERDAVRSMISGAARVQILCDAREAPALATEFPSADVVTFQDASAKGRKGRALFGKRGVPGSTKLLIASLACGALLANAGFALLASEANAAIRGYGDAMEEISLLSERSARLDKELLAASGSDDGRRGSGPGSVLLAMSAADPSLEIRSFSYSSGDFSIRARVAGAMRYAQSLIAGGSVLNVRLSDVRTITDDASLEEFTLTGTTHDR